MSTFAEVLAAAKAAPRPFRTVQVLLDTDLSEKRAALEIELEAAKAADANDQRMSAPATANEVQERLDALTDEAKGSIITLKFTRLPGNQWAELTARCPVRIEAPIDLQYGYNMHKACTLAAPINGVLLDDDDAESKLSDEEWDDLFSTISGVDFGQIIDAIYAVNAYDPAVRLNALKKALATRTA